MSEPQASWVYAAGRRLRSDRAGLTGVAGQPVRLVPAAGPDDGGLTAAVSSVSLAEFGEQALRRRLEDLDWLDAAARAHHQVIQAVAAGGPVIPMRLATVYRDDAGVAAMLADHRDSLAAALGRVTGRAEWGVKLFAPLPGAPTAPGAPGSGVPGPAGGGPGTAYLRRRQQELTAAERARQAQAAAAETVHAALIQVAAAAQQRPLQAPELTGEAAPMLLNGTYLVDDARSAEFAACAREGVARFPGIRLVLTGPWPPYSFATVTPAGDAGPDGGPG